jgi:hypothetical protein
MHLGLVLFAVATSLMAADVVFRPLMFPSDHFSTSFLGALPDALTGLVFFVVLVALFIFVNRKISKAILALLPFSFLFVFRLVEACITLGIRAGRALGLAHVLVTVALIAFPTP